MSGRSSEKHNPFQFFDRIDQEIEENKQKLKETIPTALHPFQQGSLDEGFFASMSSANGQLLSSNSKSKQQQGGYNAFFNIHFDQFSTKPLSTPVHPTSGNHFGLPSESAKEKKNNSSSGECPLAL